MSWNVVKIGKVLNQYRIEHWVQNDKLYKQVSILNDGSVVLRGEKIGKEIGRKRQFIINLDKYPDTLIFTRQLLLQGSIGMASKEVNGCIVTENMPMFSIEGINPEFLFYFIKSELFKAQVRNLKTSGTAQKSLHERQFLELEIPLPSAKEQKEIIAKCKLYESKSEKLDNEVENQQTHLQFLRQAILQEAVQGKLTKQDPKDESASKLLQRIKAEKQKLIAAGKLKKEKELPPITEEEIPFELPKGWVWCRVQEVGVLKRGKSKHRPRNDRKLFLNGSYPFIQTGEVSKAKYEGGIINSIDGYYNEFGLSQSQIQKKGTLCITIAANIAEYGFLGIDACVPDSVVCFESIDDATSKYMSFFIEVSKLMLEKLAPSTAQKNINLGILNELLFPLPPLSEQQRIVTKVEQLLQRVNQLEQQVQQSQTQASNLLQAVLKEAFSNKGKVYAENDMLTMAAEE